MAKVLHMFWLVHELSWCPVLTTDIAGFCVHNQSCRAENFCLPDVVSFLKSWHTVIIKKNCWLQYVVGILFTDLTSINSINSVVICKLYTHMFQHYFVLLIKYLLLLYRTARDSRAVNFRIFNTSWVVEILRGKWDEESYNVKAKFQDVCFFTNIST